MSLIERYCHFRGQTVHNRYVLDGTRCTDYGGILMERMDYGGILMERMDYGGILMECSTIACTYSCLVVCVFV